MLKKIKNDTVTKKSSEKKSRISLKGFIILTGVDVNEGTNPDRSYLINYNHIILVAPVTKPTKLANGKMKSLEGCSLVTLMGANSIDNCHFIRESPVEIARKIKESQDAEKD